MSTSMATAESNPKRKRGRTALPRLRVGLLFLAIGAASALGQDAPRRLPAPEIPLDALHTRQDIVTTPPSATQGVPYSGPPASIDGPERLPQVTGESLPPGITAEDLVPFADSPLGPIMPGEEY